MKKSRNRNQLSVSLVAPIRPPRVTISKVVRAATEHYLSDPKNHEYRDLYSLVLQEVEPAILEAVLEHTEGNQSEMAAILGLNRGTLRKKLDHYGLL